ncbi:hypothetical protein HBB16_02610 [Pseudonocardia sp. MCCB 268]|nr:hypothetical protein [Pseudonocardia cytotoxica]
MTQRPEGAPDPEVRAYRLPRRCSAAYKQRILTGVRAARQGGQVPPVSRSPGHL